MKRPAPMSDGFARLKWRWLDLVMHHPALSPRARLVGYEIARHLNKQTGDAWPSQETIRKNLHIKNISQVKRAIRDLQDQRVMLVVYDFETRRNSYHPNFEILRVGATAPLGGHSATITDGVHGGHSAPQWGQNSTSNGGHSAPQSSLRETVQEKVGANGSAARGADSRWIAIKNGIAVRLGPTVCEAWFERVTLEAVSADEVVLAAPSRWHAEYIENNFAASLLAACRAQHPSVERVRMLCGLAGAAQ